MIRGVNPRVIAFIVIIGIAILIGSFILGLLPPSCGDLLASESYTSDNPASLEPSVDSIQIGLVGGIETDILVTQLAGKKAVLLGTSKGLYIIFEGTLQRYIPTPSSVSDISLLNDITGDGQQEIVVAIDDIYFPNIRCYDGRSGEKIWQFAPKQDVFVENLLWTELQTSTFDIEAIDDVNSDGYQDIVATSGYCLYLLEGQTGEQIWKFEADDNLWQVSILPDIDGDGIEDLAMGAQTGFIYVLSGKVGNLIWRSKIAEPCIVFDDRGDKWATIDRSVWDIVPIEIQGKQKAIVSSEDGKVRLINLEDGTCDWETSSLIEYSSSVLYEYYRQKSKLPTSPGDFNFFNLKVSVVEDVSGDGIEEILASTYVGQRRGGKGGYAGVSGLFLIDSARGEVIWRETGLDLENMARVEIAYLDGKQVTLLPQEKSGSTAKLELVDIEDGEAIKTLEIVSTPFVAESEYWAKEYGEDSFTLVSDYEDLLCVSSQGEVLWHYPRISDVAVERGEFTGDATPDLFIWSRHPIGGWGVEFGARILYVIDGATGEKSWSYEIPYEELANIEGMTGIKVSPDLNADGKQDIVSYIQPQSAGQFGEGFRIMAFSGRDGSVLLDQPVVTQTYYGIYEQLYEAKDSSPEELKALVSEMLSQGVEKTYYSIYEGLEGKPLLKALVDDFVQQILNERGEYNPDWLDGQVQQLSGDMDKWGQGKRINKEIKSLDIINVQGEIVFLVGCPQDIFLISPKGELLWTKTYNPWVYEDPFWRINPTGMEFKAEWNTGYYSFGDINHDGIDDLLACGGTVCTKMSTWEGNKLDFKPAQVIFQAEAGTGEGVDPRQVKLVDDIDRDDIREVSFFIHRENRAPLWTIASPVSGKIMFQCEWQGGNDNCSSSFSADLNNDGYIDPILYWRGRQDYGGRPLLEIISGKDGKPLWQFTDFSECSMFDSINLQRLMPANLISDVNGDGIADLALIKFLPDQPGARVMIYDVAHNKLLKEIVIEKFDPKKRWEYRWHPGAIIKEVSDFNGDGTKEIALISMLGETRDEKEAQLMVVDVVNEQVIADFQIVGSELIEMGEHSKLGVAGLSGEFYFLDVANNLRITAPTDSSTQTSPVRIQWEGVSPGAFNQVFIDDVEVARTNENEVTVSVAHGEHKLVVRSLDEYGRGVYATVTFTVKKGNSALLFASMAMVVLVLASVSPILWRKYTRFRYKRIRHE